MESVEDKLSTNEIIAEILEDEYEVTFKWLSSIDLPAGISSVEILLAPARSVWDDNFTESSYTQNTVAYELTQHNGVFTTSIPLKTNIYHFLFRVNCTNDLAASRGHDITYLANGRMLNYVNVGDLLNKLDFSKG
jgi:hypothetical protein